MKLQHFTTTLIFLSVFQPAFSHPIFEWLNTEGMKPSQVISLSGNKKNGRVIMMYSLFDKTRIDYCYLGDVQNGRPNGEGQEFFKFDAVGFNKVSLQHQDFGSNGFYLEIKGSFKNGNIGGTNEIVFHLPNNNLQSPRIVLDKVVGALDQISDQPTFEFYFYDRNREKVCYKGGSISKEEIKSVAIEFSKTGISTIKLIRDLEGLFTRESNEVFNGICDMNLVRVNGVKKYRSGNEEFICYIEKCHVFPVRIINTNDGKFFVLTDMEQNEIKRVPIVSDTISDSNLVTSLETVQNTILKQEFTDSRTLGRDYKVYERAREFDVLLKFDEGKISMKVLPKNNMPKPVISWGKNMLVPLKPDFNPTYADGHFFWWLASHGSNVASSQNNEHSWELFDSVYDGFTLTYFGMKFEIVFQNNIHYPVELPVVFLSEEDHNQIQKLGTDAISAYQFALKEKQAKETAKKEQEIARKQQEEARVLALQKENELKREREKQARASRIKAIEKGDILCYSQEWEYSWDFLVVHDYEKYNMIATLMVEDISPSGNIIFVVNNIKSTSRERYQYMKYGNLEIKENQKISAPKSDLISDNRFQFCD